MGSYITKAFQLAQDSKIDSSQMLRLLPDDLNRIGKTLTSTRLETTIRKPKIIVPKRLSKKTDDSKFKGFQF